MREIKIDMGTHTTKAEIYHNGVEILTVDKHRITGRAFLYWKEWEYFVREIEEARKEQAEAKEKLEKELRQLIR